jgi:quercetin 2,3-dioxygenase
MITIRKADERGATRTSWLDSWHSFAFNDYRDPRHTHFGPLRVINEDVVAPGQGFPPHGHADMEIVTYIIKGALAHKDSTGGSGVIRPGEIQRMSAGTGVQHSEFNASATEPVHLLQIWMFPAHRGTKPGYEQKAFDLARAGNEMLPIVVPNAARGEHPDAVGVDQDATVYATRLGAGEERKLALAPGRRIWVQVAQGGVELNDAKLQQGDGAAIEGENSLHFRADSGAELLVFDLP